VKAFSEVRNVAVIFKKNVKANGENSKRPKTLVFGRFEFVINDYCRKHLEKSLPRHLF